MTVNTYLVIIVTSLTGAWLLTTLSSWLTLRSLSPELPAEFQGWYDPDKYARSQEYTKLRVRLDIIEESLGTALLLGLILLGGFSLLDDTVRGFGLTGIPAGIAFIGALAVMADFLSIPFALYFTFVVEERFGFNTTTPWLFFVDKVKGWILGAVIGIPFLSLILWVLGQAGETAWLWAWIAVSVIMFILQYLAPSLILPLFNKFTPLEDGELRTALEDYARSNGFSLSGIFVMDGSRRSTKSNAFFTGFGNRKRIALFDTLLTRHTTEEIVAILAHEVGHWKKGHIVRNYATAVLRCGLLFGLLSLFLHDLSLYSAFGLATPSVHTGLVFFLLLYTPISLLLSITVNISSRRHEYEADAFAVSTTGRSEPLVSALKKLTVANLGNLTPHPFTVFVSYTHPPVLQRIAALRSLL